MQHPNAVNFLLCWALLPLVFSCASMRTRQDQYAESLPLAREGSYEQAAQIIEESKDNAYKEKDRVLYSLDLGMLLHWAGKYEESNIMLTEAEYAIEELYTQSISKGITSSFLNDNALDYSGEDYEDIYLNVFKALNYIALDDFESAHVEIRRVQIKLNILEDKYRELIEEYNSSDEAEAELQYQKNRFHNSVLARYVSLLLYRNEGSLDDVRIDLDSIDEAWLTQSHLYDFEKPSMPIVETGEKALVNIISFTGLGPEKIADTLYIDTGPDMVFISMLNKNDSYLEHLTGFTAIPMPGIEPGIHFKIQFPRMQSRRSDVDRIAVKFDGRQIAELSMLEDIEKISQEIFLLRQPLTIGRTIIRAVVKNLTKEIGKEALRNEAEKNSGEAVALAFIAGIVADLVVDSSENADLRISQFFPSMAQAAEIEVEPGSYHVTVEYWDGMTLLAEIDHGLRDFHVGGLHIIESYLLQ